MHLYIPCPSAQVRKRFCQGTWIDRLANLESEIYNLRSVREQLLGANQTNGIFLANLRRKFCRFTSSHNLK
jgi:hypothetical protein